MFHYYSKGKIMAQASFSLPFLAKSVSLWEYVFLKICLDRHKKRRHSFRCTSHVGLSGIKKALIKRKDTLV